MHVVFSREASLPSSSLLIRCLCGRHPPATTLTRSGELPGAYSVLALLHGILLATPSLAFTRPLSWFSSPMGLTPSSSPFEDLYLQNTQEVVFQGSCLVLLFSSYTPFTGFVHSEVLAIFNVYTCNSDLWTKFLGLYIQMTIGRPFRDELISCPKMNWSSSLQNLRHCL